MVYFIQDTHTGNIKIGYAADPQARLATLQTGCPSTLILLGSIPGGLEGERALHSRFRKHRVRGEWYRPDPAILSLASIDRPNQSDSTLLSITVQSVGPLWKRQTFYCQESGEIYIPAAACDWEQGVFYSACFDGVPLVESRGHAYVPLSWARENYPDGGDLWDLMGGNVARAMPEPASSVVTASDERKVERTP